MSMSELYKQQTRSPAAAHPLAPVRRLQAKVGTYLSVIAARAHVHLYPSQPDLPKQSTPSLPVCSPLCPS